MASSSWVALASSITPLVRNRSTRFLPCRNFHHKWSFTIAHSESSLLRLRLLLRSPFRNPPPLMASTAPDQPAPEAPPSNPTKTVRVVIKGRVQGVFYRDWTVENASELGLNGWVRNRRDGSVEALFSGRPDSVAEMEQRCRRGPPPAMVTGFQVFPCSDLPGPGFERVRTA